MKPSTLLAFIVVAPLAIGTWVYVRPHMESQHKKGVSYGPGRVVVTMPNPIGGD